jgi:AraC family transcriptional regulator
MASHALLDQKTYRPGPNSLAQDSGRIGPSAEAVKVLDDLRRAIEEEQYPESAHAAALRLVSLLTPPAKTEPALARGGLAPWQQRKIDRYVREHLDQSIRLEDLAQQVSLSVSYFCRAFKDSFGETPHGYIIQMRLEQAQKLMLGTGEPLSQVALACGFAHQAHLSKLFRSRLGEAPNAWRRRNLTDAQAAQSSHQATEHRAFLVAQRRAVLPGNPS